MMKIEAMKFEAGKWSTVPVPNESTERIAMLSLYAGEPIVIKMTTARQERYFCGTPEIMEIVKRKYVNSTPQPLIMECEAAYNMIQYTPDLFGISVEEFFGKKEVETLFPAKGWTQNVNDTN